MTTEQLSEIADNTDWTSPTQLSEEEQRLEMITSILQRGWCPPEAADDGSYTQSLMASTEEGRAAKAERSA